MIAAGSDLVWVGEAAPWKKIPGFEEIRALPEVTVVDLDVTNPDSVKRCAGQIGPKVDILVNTAEQHRAYSVGGRYGTENARAEMEINYFGLLRLAQEFGPVMMARGADTETNAVAWVNILSIFALANKPDHIIIGALPLPAACAVATYRRGAGTRCAVARRHPGHGENRRRARQG